MTDGLADSTYPQLQSLWLEHSTMALATDLYELAMMAGYHMLKPRQTGTFELFARRLPPSRGCLIACGLEQALHYVLNLRFTSSAIQLLKSDPSLKEADAGFWQYLEDFRFTGDIWAVAEGTPVFAGEPILRVTAPLMQAQLVESYLLSVFTAQISVASKAARLSQAAASKPVFDFSMRRSAGPQAALFAARASYISGFAGTSCVLASKLLGIADIGTMAHSWVMSFADEQEAFNEFRKLHPSAMLLIDTYDTLLAAHKAAATGPGLAGVRIDSGDLSLLSQQVRKILDEAGQSQAKIVVSGNLNETAIRNLESQCAPIDGYAVGGELVHPHDAPAVDLVYKLVEIEDGNGNRTPVFKSSTNKTTLAGCKQVFRLCDNAGHYVQDIIASSDEQARDIETCYPATGWLMQAQPLLVPVVIAGKLVNPLPDLNQVRQHAKTSRHLLGAEYFACGLPDSQICKYRVQMSKRLQDLQPQKQPLT